MVISNLAVFGSSLSVSLIICFLETSSKTSAYADVLATLELTPAAVGHVKA